MTICQDSDRHQARLILETIITKHGHKNLPYSELKAAIEEIEESVFCQRGEGYLSFDGNEYRIILDSAISDIYIDEIKRIVTDCYDLNLDKIPSFIAVTIDWVQTARNAFVDGFGHTFSTYDGSEYETDNGYWIFRTN